MKFGILEQFSHELLNFVTTRQEPDGQGSDFNIGYSGGSDEQTYSSRVTLADALGLKEENFVFQNQVHKDNYTIASRMTGGSGFASKATAVADNDILITNTPGICLVTRSADCVPVLIYSPDSKSAAAVHSGREGTYLGAAAKAARLLNSEFGARMESLVCCIGPAIGFECYEVDQDCARKFVENPRFGNHTYKNVGSKVHLDLKAMIAGDLAASGVNPSNIEISGTCTKCNHGRYYSARMGDHGRFCAGIMIRE